MKRSPISSAFLFLLLAITGCISFSGVKQGISAIGNPMIVASLFFSENNRWPTNRVELADYAAKHPEFAFTNSLYSTLTLDVDTNGSLTIHTVLAPPLQADWTMRLDKSTNTATRFNAHILDLH